MPVDLEQKRILLTGAGGFIAAALERSLRQIDCEILRVSRRELPPVASSVATITDRPADIREPGVWDDLLDGIDVVFHLAAQTSVPVANRDPLADHAANVLPVMHLVDTCQRRDWHPVVLFAGTVTQSGVSSRQPVGEDVPDAPPSVYDLHKLMAEQTLKFHARQGLVRAACLRLPNIYGPGPPSSSSDRGILNLMIRKALSGEDLTVYGSGEFLRDYLFVDDVASAFLQAVTHIDAINTHHCVIGTETGHSLKDAFQLVARTVERQTGRQVAVVHVDPPEGLSALDERDFVADTTLFQRLTGWNAAVSLEAGIEKTVQEYA